MDIILVVEKDGYIRVDPYKERDKLIAKHELYPLKEYVFGEIKLYGPNYPDPFLNRFYGKDWNLVFVIPFAEIKLNTSSSFSNISF